MNRPLHRCPTCTRDLDDETRRAMGLRTGEVLNALCPGLNGPSDVDHVLHNAWSNPERLVWIEYKNRTPVQYERVDGLTGGQVILRDSVRGRWCNEDDGRRLDISYVVCPLHPDDPEAEMRPIVDWLWRP